GQILRTSLEGDGVILSVLDANDRALRGGRQVLDWQGELPEDGRYRVQVQTTRGTEQGTYELGLALTAAASDSPDEDTSVPLPTDGNGQPGGNNETDTDESENGAGESDSEPPEVQEQVSSQRVLFPEGQTSTLLASSVGPGQVQKYVINAQQGQIITVKITQASGPVTFDVSFPGGESVADAEGVLYWNSYLPLGGDYEVDVRSSSAAEFTLDVQIVGQGSP
ncbi:MAG: hypothetical protein AAFR30_04540, partial [Cyanobacteria bacterium J06628_4]